MISYAFPVEPDDIYDVLLQLSNMGATWWGSDIDPVDYFNTYIKHKFLGDSIVLYIEEKNSKYKISYSKITYLKENFQSESDSDDFTIVDSFYSITEFTSYSDLGDNTINFCEI